MSFLIPWESFLALRPQGDVKFPAPPEKSFPVEGGANGGVSGFESPKSGRVRVAAGSKIWFDVVDRETKKPVEARAFEMQTGCDKIFKVVEFELRARRGYVLQVSSGGAKTAEFLITAE